ncbi:MAG: hypothetical protein IJ593_04985 [Lachnospiraceae bacterium]|nr:hypothetical protein [Lachnospiraceae bacterium]
MHCTVNNRHYKSILDMCKAHGFNYNRFMKFKNQHKNYTIQSVVNQYIDKLLQSVPK